jgi:8-oxo-dGTP pyrophosphatase MutT (NUDIX family)
VSDSALSVDALRVLSGWSAPEAEQEALRSSYVELLRRRPDAVWRTCVPAHLTASAMVVDSSSRRVLLTLHGKGRFWAQLGGHCEAGDGSLAAAALREAAEESGIEGLRLIGEDPVDLDRHALAPVFGSCGEHLDVRFAVVAPEHAVELRSAESADLRWFDAGALPVDAVDDLSRLVRRALDRATQPE